MNINTSSEHERTGMIMKINRRQALFFVFMFALLLLEGATIAYATSTTTGVKEWETPLQKIRDSITGPVAFSVSALMLVAGGCGIAFGGDMSGWLRYVLISCLVIGVLGFVIPILGTIFGLDSSVVL